MFLLDTNIVSLFDPRRRVHAGPVIEWMRRNDRALWMSVVTLTEIEAGILKLRRDGKDRRAAEIEDLREGVIHGFSDRLLPMDASVALKVARLAESVRPAVIDLKDLIIAATAGVRGPTVLTHNVRHFEGTGVAVMDPLGKLPPDGAR